MKKIITALLFLVIVAKGHSQFAVTAPVLETIAGNQTGILGTMSTTMVAIKKVEQRIEKLKEAAGWIEKLESMQEFVQLLENTSCLAKDLNADMQLGMDLVGPRASCLNTFKYQVNINQLRYVVDIVNVVLTDGFSMDRAGRLEAYEHALSAFEESQTGLGELSVELKRIVRRSEDARRFREDRLLINAIGMQN
ncbi:MAG: hypothetical protein RIA62_17440 [Cyclobacteriaceae bacterium]|tara:strand:- start:1458 stop:2039 length:582 start_codon:yes stop_codon:yes gene_type:complete